MIMDNKHAKAVVEIAEIVNSINKIVYLVMIKKYYQKRNNVYVKMVILKI